MARFVCSGCGWTVEDGVPLCPHCGIEAVPFQPGAGVEVRPWFLYFGLAGILIGLTASVILTLTVDFRAVRVIDIRSLRRVNSTQVWYAGLGATTVLLGISGILCGLCVDLIRERRARRRNRPYQKHDRGAPDLPGGGQAVDDGPFASQD